MRTATYDAAWLWKAPGEEDVYGASASVQLCGAPLHIDTIPVGADPRGRQTPAAEWTREYAALRQLAGADDPDIPLATIDLDGLAVVPFGYPFCSGAAGELTADRAHAGLLDPATPLLTAESMWRPRADGGYDAPLELCGAPMLARLIPAGVDLCDIDPDDPGDAALLAAAGPGWPATAQALFDLSRGEDAGPLNRTLGPADQTGGAGERGEYVLVLLPEAVHR